MDHLADLLFFFSLCKTNSQNSLLDEGKISPETGWREFVDFCVSQGVAAYLHSKLTENQISISIPQAFKSRLKQVYFASTAMNLALKNQLSEIIEALDEQHIPLIPLKGTYLSLNIYKNPPARMMTDIDLLLRKEDLPEALKTMNRLGYESDSKYWESPGHHLPPFKKQGAVFPVEIHWRLIPPTRMQGISPDTIWGNARHITLAGKPCQELNPAHTLLHICQHTAYQHFFSNGTKALCDIDAIVNFFEGELDWMEFLEITRSLGGEKGILLTLWLGNQKLGTVLPPQIEEAIAKFRFPENASADALAIMACGKEFPDAPPERWREKINWGIGKFRKVIGEMQYDSANTGQTAAFTSARNKANRLGYVFKDNFTALRQVLRKGDDGSQEKSERRLRHWLNVK